ncbi:MAG: HD domain-containing protein [Richelia sp. RM2_1_2]|nr:HD domain-containing protein [Richelia sp. RM2_1_2]
MFLAALFHDVGKLWDYTPYKKYHNGYEEAFFSLQEILNCFNRKEPNYMWELCWKGNPHKRLIHHISRSALCFQEAALKYNLSSEITDNILHAILSHHGLKEWGSPVAPKTRLAWLLHLCDGLSARMNDCNRVDAYLEKPQDH